MEIIAYTSAGCFYCDQLKELFKRFDIEYTAIQVKKDITLEDFRQKYPAAESYPHVVIDGDVIGGLTQTAKYLMDQGLVYSKKHGQRS